MSDLFIDSSYTGLNAATSSQASDKSSNDLDQADFMSLLVAQIKNQDPTEPLDAAKFMDQLTQLTTVSGIQDLNSSFSQLADDLAPGQLIQAASLVGRDVMVPGGIGVLQDNGTMSGAVELPRSASELAVTIYDQNGIEVREMTLGGNARGPVAFQWDGIYDNGNAALGGNYNIIAEAFIDGELESVDVSLETRIDSITLNQAGEEATLNLASGISVPFSYVQQIK